MPVSVLYLYYTIFDEKTQKLAKMAIFELLEVSDKIVHMANLMN